MTKAHSTGNDFPITHHCVGGYPTVDNQAYWVVQHPAGTKRWCLTAGYRDELIANFKKADEEIQWIDFNVVSERTAFEIALLSVEKGSDFKGNKLDAYGKGGW